MPSVFSISQSVNNIKFTELLDTPGLQLWLDASDTSTVNTSQTTMFFPDWSWYFDGSLSYLTTPNIFDFGTNDFTIEFWSYIENTNSRLEIFSNEKSGLRSIICYILNKRLNFYAYNTNNASSADVVSIISDIICEPYSWTHFAITRNGSVFTVFVNGIGKTASSSKSIQFHPTTLFQLGARVHTNNYFKGYLSNFRIIIGTALYTTDFSNNLPTAPLPLNIPNTVLQVLTRHNDFTDYSSNACVFTKFGSLTETNGVLVNLWKDKSPNGLSATQMSVPNMPFYTTLRNGLKVVVFDGRDDYLNLSSLIQADTDYTSIFVYKRANLGVDSVALGNTLTDFTSTFMQQSGRFYGGNKYADSTQLQQIGLFVGAFRKNEELYINQINVPFSGSWGGSPKTPTVGCVGVYRNGTYHSNEFCEYILTSKMLPAYELELLSKKLTDKWSVPDLTPTPLPTQTQTPSNTQTPTQTQTQTPSNTQTPTQTQTQTPSNTQTPTQTQTQTPSNTQTPTQTQTQTPTQTIPSGLTYIYDSAGNVSSTAGNPLFGSIPDNWKKGVSLINHDVSVGTSSARIGSFAFYQTGIRSVTIPSTVTSIGTYAFYMTRISSVTIGNSVSAVDQGAFSNISYLRDLTIPNSVTSIKGNAFQNCNLTAVNCFASRPAFVGTGAFNNNTSSPTTLTFRVRSTDASWSAGTQSFQGTNMNVVKNL